MAAWQNDLTRIGPSDWNPGFAAHLLERAGFGGTPEEVQALAKMTPAQAVARLVHFEGTDVSHLAPFDPSGVHDPGLEPFPPSRPAVISPRRRAKRWGSKLSPRGVKGGHYGAIPSLTKLDAGDNLIYTTDFRRVYATMISKWLGYSGAKQLLNGDFASFEMFQRSA